MHIDLRETELRLKRTWTISRGAADSKRNLFVRLEEDGITGEGEAACQAAFGESPESVRAALERTAGRLHGCDPAQVDGLDIGGAARAALEMALLDWNAKRAGAPLGIFLGVPPPAAPVVTSYSLGIDRPGVMAAKVAEARPFGVLKVKLGAPGGGDRAIVDAIRAVTDVPLRIDANGGWQSVDEAARMIDWLAEEHRGVQFIEQPLPMGRLEETARLKARSALPLVADEDVRVAADLPALADCYHGINIKLMKAGGVREARTLAGAARSAGMHIMIGCMIESSLGIAAALHLASLADWIDLDGHLLLANDPYTGIGGEDGRLVPPTAPGIGVQPATPQ
ncbi:MAG: dipeptide epimerase [Akkermansiaceae bacterium]|nr:dipeptide epimerase [Akkermansiaceae bacterium]NNM28157.1 dipeptide epimerase [Akkermansiaceae bacterium]